MLKKVFYQMKYYWHSLQYQKNQTILNDCLCNELRASIKEKIEYHEREAIQNSIRR